MFPGFLAILVLTLMPVAAHAEAVTCPGKVDHVLMSVGPLLMPSLGLYSNAIEQDVGGDYDEKAPFWEWNLLNHDAKTTPVVAHCFKGKNNKGGVSVPVPPSIHRCILHSGVFLCKSGTVACPGYADLVRLEARKKDGAFVELKPETVQEGNVSKLVWKSLGEKEKGAALVASCAIKEVPKIVNMIPVPDGMKECSLFNKRFRCTAEPEKHDFFWPEK